MALGDKIWAIIISLGFAGIMVFVYFEGPKAKKGQALKPNSRMASKSLQNQNYLNVKVEDTRDPWLGTTGYDSQGHVIFDDPAWGIRAAIKSIVAKWNNGKDTIRDLVMDWTVNQEHWEAYSQHVSNELEWPPDAQLPLIHTRGISWPLMKQLLTAMAQVECGASFTIPGAELERGLLYYKTN